MTKGDDAGISRPRFENLRDVTVAHAHTGIQSYAWVVVQNRRVTGAVEFPVTEVVEVLDLPIPSNKEAGTAFVENHFARLASYADLHLSISGNGNPWQLRFLGARVFEHPVSAYVQIDYEALNGRVRPEHLTIAFDGIVEAKPDHDAEVIVKNGTGWGRLQRFDEVKLGIDKHQSSHTISLTKPSWTSNLAVAVREGTRRARKRIRARMGSE